MGSKEAELYENFLDTLIEVTISFLLQPHTLKKCLVLRNNIDHLFEMEYTQIFIHLLFYVAYKYDILFKKKGIFSLGKIFFFFKCSSFNLLDVKRKCII